MHCPPAGPCTRTVHGCGLGRSQAPGCWEAPLIPASSRLILVNQEGQSSADWPAALQEPRSRWAGPATQSEGRVSLFPGPCSGK